MSAFHQKMAPRDAYQVLFFVSFKMNPRSSPTGGCDKSMLPQSPERLPLSIDPHSRGGGTTKISSNASRGMPFEEYYGKNAVKRPRLRRIHFNHLHLFPPPGDSPSGHRGEPSLFFSLSLLIPISIFFFSCFFPFLISKPLPARQ